MNAVNLPYVASELRFGLTHVAVLLADMFKKKKKEKGLCSPSPGRLTQPIGAEGTVPPYSHPRARGSSIKVPFVSCGLIKPEK